MSDGSSSSCQQQQQTQQKKDGNTPNEDETESRPAVVSPQSQNQKQQHQQQSQPAKWICEYCTYENFPLSLKCTMCKGQKPLLNEDIFRFYPRWKENEIIQAALLHYTLAETQLEEDWSTLLSLASQPGSSLEQLHIFVLAHILRRPIIVYGVKYVKSFRGEDIGYARFEGVYLPLLWEQSFCITSPIALGYTRGHFSALVPTEPYSRIEASRDDREDITFLPLMNCEMKLLPIHFLNNSEIGREEAMMRQWLDICETEGLLVAQQKLHKRPLLVAQMLEEWLNHYRRIAISRLF